MLPPGKCGGQRRGYSLIIVEKRPISALMRRISVILLALLAIAAPCLALFDQRLSSSFESKEHLPFLLRYAEWGYLTAPQVAVEKFTDIISLGSHNSRIDMGLVKHSKLTATEFKGVDGVLGLGFSNVSHKGSLVETLIVGGDDQPSGFLPLSPQKFSVVASRGAGELQLGGYNPDAVLEGPVMLDVLPHDFQYGNAFGYSFALSDLKVCGESIIPAGVHFSALLQAGPVCVGLPANAIGYTGGSPLAKYLSASRKCSAGGQVEFVSQGHTFSFPAEQLTKAGGGCVRGHEQTSNFVSLGDPFFRNFLVLHDLTDMFTTGDIRVGLARRNLKYNIGSQMQLKSDKTGVEHIALTSIPYDLGVRYLANIGVGSPPQEQVAPPPVLPSPPPPLPVLISPRLRNAAFRSPPSFGVLTAPPPLPLTPQNMVLDTGTVLIALFPVEVVATSIYFWILPIIAILGLLFGGGKTVYSLTKQRAQEKAERRKYSTLQVCAAAPSRFAAS
jgi:hypothetical protein